LKVKPHSLHLNAFLLALFLLSPRPHIWQVIDVFLAPTSYHVQPTLVELAVDVLYEPAIEERVQPSALLPALPLAVEVEVSEVLYDEVCAVLFWLFLQASSLSSSTCTRRDFSRGHPT